MLTTSIYSDSIVSNKENDDAEAPCKSPASESRLRAERAVAGVPGVPLRSASETRSDVWLR